MDCAASKDALLPSAATTATFPEPLSTLLCNAENGKQKETTAIAYLKSKTFPANTKKLHNICTMLVQRLDQHCANVIQMFFACWVTSVDM